MFSLQEIRRAHEIVLGALRPTPALNWPLLDERLGAEVVVKHENHLPTGAFKVRGGLTYVDALIRREPATRGIISATRGNHGQSLAFAGRRAGLQVTILAPQGNSTREERRHAGARRGADRIRARLSGRARGGDAARERARSAPGSFVPSRSGARRLDLRARTSERAPGPRRALRSDRSGLGNLRLHRGARRPGSEDGDRRRAIDGSAGLLAVVCRRPRRAHQQRRHACRRHGDACPRSGGARSHPQGRGAGRAGQRRRDRRGGARLLDRYAQPRRGRGRGGARGGGEGALASQGTQGRARAVGRQHRLRPLPAMGRGRAERRRPPERRYDAPSRGRREQGHDAHEQDLDPPAALALFFGDREIQYRDSHALGAGRQRDRACSRVSSACFRGAATTSRA